MIYGVRIILFLFTFLLIPTFAWPQEGILNKLLAPGPLVKGHSHLEKKDCLKCHAAGQGVPDSKCLECHKDIKPFLDKKSGFHGLVNKACKECHLDHKGRNFDSISIDEKAFDHLENTGYSLDGKHRELRCSECHKGTQKPESVLAGKIRYFGAQSTCVSCHKKDDVHFYKNSWAKKDCNECHTLKSWNDNIKFNHKTDALYELSGKHSTLKCADCHAPKNAEKMITEVIYKWPKLKSLQCLTCHKDQHKNNLSMKFRGGQCNQCHTQEEWKIPLFDHKITEFPLREKHFELKCNDCHKQQSHPQPHISDSNFKFNDLKTQCLSCHKDFHLFKGIKHNLFGNLNRCNGCHNEASWKETERFNHSQHTRYKLDGKHLSLNCRECHIKKDKDGFSKDSIYRWPQLNNKNCETCHSSPHLKQFSNELLKKSCTECHITSSWYDMKDGKKFDHSKTQFPLSGAHENIRCTNCHGPQGKQVFKFKTPSLQFCIDCHNNIHSQQFSKSMDSNRCTSCHSTKNFKDRLTFDHSKTRYPLEGSHRTLQCSECHIPTKMQIALAPPNISTNASKTVKLASLTLSQFSFPHVKTTECLSCHMDYHQKQLSKTCLDCHTVDSWKKTRFVHNKQSEFILKFKHESLKCSECHKPISNQTVILKNESRKIILYKPINSACVTCHKDFHKGEFGSKCQECHTEKGWKATKDFHKNFTLTGVHFSLNCAECHKDNRKLAGTSAMCISCHAKDDVHSGTLPQCQECHRQQFWEVTGFKHSLTLFPLRGVHRTIDCMECHRSGTYKGLNPLCSSCHLSDALRISSPNHSSFPNLQSCNECHLNHFSWGR